MTFNLLPKILEEELELSASLRKVTNFVGQEYVLTVS